MKKKAGPRDSIRNHLSYSPDTGIFTWTHPLSRRVRAGSVAGTVTDGGYRIIMFDCRVYRASSLAMFFVDGTYPEGEVDHINRNRLDDRRSNLRLSTPSQNRANATARTRNRSGFKGVSISKHTGRWQSILTFEGKRHFLGRFDTPEKAAAAYDDAARVHFGEFAVLNFPENRHGV